MDVSAFGVRQLTQYSRPGQIEHQELVLPIAAILQHDTVPLRALTRVHQAPTILHGDGGRHFHQGVLAEFHRSHAHRHMGIPRRGDVNDIKISPRHHLLPNVFVAAIHGRTFPPHFFTVRRRPLGPLVDDITHGDHVSEFNSQRIFDVTHPAMQADDPDAHPL